MKCTGATPYARPGFDWIATKLRQISHLFEKKDQANISMVRATIFEPLFLLHKYDYFQLQIYSRRLEERLGDMGDVMVAERDYSNDVIQSEL